MEGLASRVSDLEQKIASIKKADENYNTICKTSEEHSENKAPQAPSNISEIAAHSVNTDNEIKQLHESRYAAYACDLKTAQNTAAEEQPTWMNNLPDENEATNNDFFGQTYSNLSNCDESVKSHSPSLLANAKKDSLEMNLASKIPVWVGAVSLIFAAFFLVKYSIELGWVGPRTRVFLGVIFGLCLISGGQWVRPRYHIANAQRIGQGLVGAGLVALYVSLYSAINLYHMMPPLLGFAAMSIITAWAVFLSLRHGEPIALFGLLGGLLTPALIHTGTHSAIVLFSYLFLLFTGIFVVLIRRNWWNLAWASIIGMFMWSFVWFLTFFNTSDSVTLLLFSMAVMTAVLIMTGKHIIDHNKKDPREEQSSLLAIHGINFTALSGGIITVIWLSFKITLTLFDWSMLGLITLAMMTLAHFHPNTYYKPLVVKLVASLILYFSWAQDVSLIEAVLVLLGIALIYIGGAAILMRQVFDPRFWAIIQVSTALSLYLIAYFVLDLPEQLSNGKIPFWGIIALALAAIGITQTSNILKTYRANNLIRDHLVAIFALATSTFISLGLSIELPWSYIPLAIAAQIAATAWVMQSTQIMFLKRIMLYLTVIFAGFNYKSALIFISLCVESLSKDVPDFQVIARYAPDSMIINYCLPAIFIAISLWIIDKIKLKDSMLSQVLFTIFALLAFAGFYGLFRQFIHPSDNIFSTPANFFERGIITLSTLLAGIFILKYSKQYPTTLPLSALGYVAIHFGMARFAYFDLIIYNPFWDYTQLVGSWPIFNGVSVTYGIGTALLVWMIFNKDILLNKTPYKILVLCSLFTFTSLTVRQFYNGESLFHHDKGITAAEMYTYSIAWLFTGLALLAAGIKYHSKNARMASLIFILLAIIKVFIFDAATLQGLYRIFSFLGLGASLIGLSYFYTKFVFKNHDNP